MGNAVPPPLSRAIGLEIKKCILERIKEEGVQGESTCPSTLIQFIQLSPPPETALLSLHGNTNGIPHFAAENVKEEKMEVID